MMRPQNPYIVGQIVTGEGRFFGRGAELDRLRGVLLRSSTPQHVSVTGESRSGKTSLLMEFLRQEGEAIRQRYSVSVLDLSADFVRGTANDFYQQLGDFAIDAVAAAGNDVDALADDWSKVGGGRARRSLNLELKKLFLQIGERFRPLLFVFDEFDCGPALTGGDPDAFKILRSLGLYAKATFLIASRGEIDEIEKDAGVSSNFAGIFDLSGIRVGPLPAADAEQLCQEPLRRSGLSWDPAVVTDLLRLSGGHPYLLQGLCHRLLDEAWGNPPAEQRAHLLRIAPEAFRPLFEIQSRRLARGAGLEALREVLEGRAQQIERVHIERLERLGYLVRKDRGVLEPFTPLLRDALGVGGGPSSTQAIVVAFEPLEELLASWGLQIGGNNVLVEGETDRDLIGLASRAHLDATGDDLTAGIAIVPAGLGRNGGVGPVARRLVTVIEAARGRKTKAIALLDYDEMGRRVAEALDRIGAQKGKDYLLLDRADFPILKYKGTVQVEIEDLLSRRLLETFATAHPEAVEEKLDRGADGVRFAWRGQHKAALVDFVREHGTAADFERIVKLVARLRNAFASSAPSAARSEREEA